METLIASLISLVRTGWMLRGVPASMAETVSTHSFLTSLYALVISTKLSKYGFKLDIGKIVSMAVVHDLPEAFIGDIVSSKIPMYLKVKDEFEISILSKNLNIDIIKELFREYTLQKNIESKIVKLADYLATLAVAKYYKKLGYKVDDIIQNMEKQISNLIKELQINIHIDELLDITRQ